MRLIRHIKKNKKRYLQAGATTWILLMFGMTLMLYMFNFTNLYTGYQNNTGIDTGAGTDVGNPNLAAGEKTNPLTMIMNAIGENLPTIVGGGILTAVALVLIGRFIGGSGAVSTILSYAIPAVILGLFLNIFVFPISTISSDLSSIDNIGIPATFGLFAFFNICLIMAIVDFVTGRQT